MDDRQSIERVRHVRRVGIRRLEVLQEPDRLEKRLLLPLRAEDLGHLQLDLGGEIGGRLAVERLAHPVERRVGLSAPGAQHASLVEHVGDPRIVGVLRRRLLQETGRGQDLPEIQASLGLALQRPHRLGRGGAELAGLLELDDRLGVAFLGDQALAPHHDVGDGATVPLGQGRLGAGQPRRRERDDREGSKWAHGGYSILGALRRHPAFA